MSLSVGAKLSVAFIVNQIFGPGVLAIPIVFQQAGWLLATLALLFFMAVSCFSSTLLCAAIARIPGNSRFERRIEFAGVVEYYLGKRAVSVFYLFYMVTIQSYNVASIVIVANSIDQVATAVCCQLG
jgi:amino acid permease